MSRYDPPQCQICADYWLKEGRPMGHYLIVSRGGHIPGVHQPSSGRKVIMPGVHQPSSGKKIIITGLHQGGRESGSPSKNTEKSAREDEKNASKTTAHQGEKSGQTASSG